ncbi:MAG: trehalose-6-phosphate synthase [Gemmatimonadota bacterium]
MSKLVVVSNRLPPMPEKGSRSRSQEVGGLASALISALDVSGGGIWFGWSGKTSQRGEGPPVSWESGKNRIVGIDLSDREVDAYYNGFCNRSLWPLLHSFQGRVRISRAEDRIYSQVNARFARHLLRYLEPGDMVWVHDYHLFLLGQELRRAGHTGRIGYFLHVPFPSYDIWQILPEPTRFLRAMLDYDLVGFHTRTYRDNYAYAAQRILHASWDGTFLRAGEQSQRVGIFPIGVDPDRFAGFAAAGSSGRQRGLREPGDDRRLILGVDRLDYTKGIPQRIQSFEALLRSYPHYRGRVWMAQICAPSRTRVPEYIEQKRVVESLVGRINGEFSEHDRVPIRYLYRSYPQERLGIFYRGAHVCLVTPLRDGMNLVAKEYIACQDPDDPGVLVLSRFAGAAEEMAEAVLVNPYLPEDVADGIHRALSMPRRERVERHRKLLEQVRLHTSDWWFKSFLRDLADDETQNLSLAAGTP